MCRKGRKRNRANCGVESRTRLLAVVAVAWLGSTASSLPVVSALPEVKGATSALYKNVERAVEKKTKQKIEVSLRTQKMKKKNDESVVHAKSDNHNDETNGLQNRVKVESFLTHRSFPVRSVLRVACLLLAARAFFQCSQTSGIPYAQTVFQIVYGSSKAQWPTAMERKLAQMILSTSNEFNVMLPPKLLPSAGPLLKFVVSLVAYVLTFLLPYWSTQFRMLLDYQKVEKHTSKENMSVLVRLDTPSSEKGQPQNLQIIPLQQSSKKKKEKLKNDETTTKRNNSKSGDGVYSHPSDFFFDVDHSRIYCNLDTKECIDGAPSLQTAPLSALQDLVEGGGLSQKQRKLAKERYQAYNTFPLATPTFKEAFLERISSPLVVIQLVGRLVSLLEEGMGAAISMVMTLAQHYYNAKQAIVSATQLADEVKTNLQDTSGYEVKVWNESKQQWVSTPAGKLVPGDIFKLTMNTQDEESKTQKQQELIVPVDALVVKGQCLTNEAILTGESVPQIKIPLDFDQETTDASTERRLDLHKDRSSVLFAGTTLFHTIGGGTAETSDKKNSTVGGVTCIALRTGTYSSKGRLLKALKGKSHVGAISNQQSNKDAIRMIASLSACAVLSCLSLFVNGNAKVSPFRRVIQCTRIALASIPSDLPLAQAYIARSCSKMLRDQSDVVCSEPGSLLTAAYIDTVVFDKTGTLTADTQSLAKVVQLESQPEHAVSAAFERFVLAGCHSLVHFKENEKTSVVGDPLDQAALQFSGWKYNQTSTFFFRPESETEPILDSEPFRLWQIRDFPFDPSRRLSSAIVLLQRKDSSLELWKLTKGSPDTMIDLFEKDSTNLAAELSNKTQELEMQGYRCISLGAQNLGDSSIAQALFPNGLSESASSLAHARTKSEALHRNAIDKNDPGNVETGLKFCGFCCFDASTRPSSKRVINELVRGGLKCVMLTGDSVDAALSVGRKVELFKHRKIAVLERSEGDGNEELVWKTLHSKVKKDGSFRILHDRTKIEKVTVSSVKKFIKYSEEGKYSLAANGRALELIFSQPNKVGKLIAKNLSAVSVIARATPELKKQVIETLKQDCAKRVMMCGDGVNDVAAIQSADVAASLLTGFGSEKDISGIDVDDDRRMKRLATMKIGGNRLENAGKAKKKEANERINREVETIREEIEKRASLRAGNEDSELSEKQYTFEDMKEMVSATMRAAKKERLRAEQLKKGGGDAARILAEERKQQLSSENEDDASTPSIKPGEASLVSSFSCLHPSVDGIDAILREGIATAASSLATQQGIGLHSLMSCYHLATLYRDGFRYGNHMWNVEIFFYQLLENARSKASCTPRPRLPSSVLNRPPTSLFEFVSIFGIVSQAIIHVSCMALCVRYAKHIESTMSDSEGHARIILENVFASGSVKVGKLMDTLTKRSLLQDLPEADTNTNPFFQRPPFRPNYETNSVFLLSILQSAISALVSHTGAPFYRDILESRDLCVMSGATLLFVMICITGKMPALTSFLQVKSLPSRQSKTVFLCIVMINIIGCACSRFIMDNFHSKSTYFKLEETKAESDNLKRSKNAADHEEKLLTEEMEQNLKVLRIFGVIMVYFMIDTILSK